MPTFTLGQIADRLGIAQPADSGRAITGLSTLREASPSDLSFLGSERFARELLNTQAGAVLVSQKVKIPGGHSTTVILVEDADLAMAEVLEMFAPPIDQPEPGIDPAARIHPQATVGPGARIGPWVSVGAHTRIGQNCTLHPGASIGSHVEIGDDCVVFPNVVVRERVSIGSRVIIHAGSVIGTDGFGYRWDGQQHRKIPQIGTIIIGDDVEIGSCVCIDRAKLGTTRIGNGTKFDNLVQVGHNVQIGEHSIIVAQVGIAGSARVGTGVVLGGQTAVRDHVEIGDGAMSAACSAIAEDVDPKAIVSGIPALPHRQSLREQAHLRRLPELSVQVKKLQEQLNQLLGQTKKK